ncbi:MAG: hypothetical protein ACI80L_000801 [Pseudohongiellaceae bacterium]|jgi:hypothetical protein
MNPGYQERLRIEAGEIHRLHQKDTKISSTGIKGEVHSDSFFFKPEKLFRWQSQNTHHLIRSS